MRAPEAVKAGEGLQGVGSGSGLHVAVFGNPIPACLPARRPPLPQVYCTTALANLQLNSQPAPTLPPGASTSHGSRRISALKDWQCTPAAASPALTSLSRTIEMGS